ncbi:hypothetical protein BC831DRAFT_481005 [Entophlyctis helioformis]|nr:hypothetical protein BC831DRAFT_481005 [Entophlyctis helioformis]
MPTLARTLDLAALGLSTFYYGQVTNSPASASNSTRPALLWMYFVTPSMRSVVYLGLATRLVVDALTFTPVASVSNVLYGTRTGFLATVSLLSASAYVNLVNPSFKPWTSKPKSRRTKRHRRTDSASSRSSSSSANSSSQHADKDSTNSRPSRSARQSARAPSGASASDPYVFVGPDKDKEAASNHLDAESDYDNDNDGDDDYKGFEEGIRQTWHTSATDGFGWLGAWWFGAGNGDWFGFIGHNGGLEKTILPASILEQMTVSRESKDPGVASVEELP